MVSKSVGVRCWHTLPIPLGLFFLGGSGRSDCGFEGFLIQLQGKLSFALEKLPASLFGRITEDCGSEITCFQ